MDVDYDDMDMHAMRDTLPQSQIDVGGDNDVREDLEVQWKSSQTSNRALDSLMLEAAQNATSRVTGLRGDWSWGVSGEASAASTSRVKSLPSLLFGQPPPSSSATSGTAAVPSRRRGRASNAHTPSPSMGGPATPATPDPAQFLKLMKGVSKQADENAGMRARAASGGWGDAACVASAAGGRGARQSVKQRTMSTRRASASGLGTGTKGKERERDRDRAPITRTPSSVSPSSVSSPASNYSFLSTDADSSMTSPDRDDWKQARERVSDFGTRTTTQDLMPPPPVPQKQKLNRLPALDVCTPPLRKPPPELQADSTAPAPAPVAVKLEQSPVPVRAGDGPDLRLHPLLQQQKPAPPPSVPRNANENAFAPPAASTRTHASTSTHTHALPQSQPQPQRRGPPVLGMRRTNTAPPLGGSASTEGPSSQTATRKFRPPLLDPETALASVVAAGAARVQVKDEKTDIQVPANIPKPGPPPAVRMAPRIAEPLKPVTAEPSIPVVMSTPQRKTTQPAPASSPWSDNSFDEHNSFDLDELEKVMKEYDD